MHSNVQQQEYAVSFKPGVMRLLIIAVSCHAEVPPFFGSRKMTILPFENPNTTKHRVGGYSHTR
eukprot:2349371-Amphidinium_carterae.1